MQKAALYASGFIFATGATFHLLRLVTGMEITAAGYVSPKLTASLYAHFGVDALRDAVGRLAQ